MFSQCDGMSGPRGLRGPAGGWVPFLLQPLTYLWAQGQPSPPWFSHFDSEASKHLPPGVTEEFE